MPDRLRAAKEARALLQKHGVGAAPVDVFSLADRVGVRVVRQPLDDDLSGILVRSDDSAVIGVNIDHHPNRQRFTLAHELAHFVLHADKPTVYVDDLLVHFRGESLHAPQNSEEVEANVFAAELLMPEEFLMNDLKTKRVDAFDEVAVRNLARKYGVSVQALSIRLSQLGWIDGLQGTPG